MPDVQVILPDGRQIVAQIPDGTENPREFVINELTNRGLLGLPPLTTEQQQAITAVPPAQVPRFGPLGTVVEEAPPTVEALGAAVGIEGGAPAGARLEAGFAADPAQGAADINTKIKRILCLLPCCATRGKSKSWLKEALQEILPRKARRTPLKFGKGSSGYQPASGGSASLRGPEGFLTGELESRCLSKSGKIRWRTAKPEKAP